jgi:hypothetical protein
VIPKSRKAGERLIQVLTNPKKDKAESLVFQWIDTKDTRPDHSTLYVLLNDTEKSVSEPIVDALKNYQLNPVRWSDRAMVREKLLA